MANSDTVDEVVSRWLRISKRDLLTANRGMEADNLTDYAVEIRYPDDWYEPSIEETKEAIHLAEKVYDFVSERLRQVH